MLRAGWKLRKAASTRTAKRIIAIVAYGEGSITGNTVTMPKQIQHEGDCMEVWQAMIKTELETRGERKEKCLTMWERDFSLEKQLNKDGKENREQRMREQGAQFQLLNAPVNTFTFFFRRYTFSDGGMT